jgi:hypothetical protein
VQVPRATWAGGVANAQARLRGSPSETGFSGPEFTLTNTRIQTISNIGPINPGGPRFNCGSAVRQFRHMGAHRFAQCLQVVAAFETRNDSPVASLLRPVLDRAGHVNEVFVFE